MTERDLLGLVMVLAASVGAVFLADAARRLLVSLVVIEILLGVGIGPHAMGVVTVTPFVTGLAGLGVCFLFFLAGHEIVITRILGWPMKIGGVGWLASFALAVCVGVAVRGLGIHGSLLPLALALATTALGVLTPVLRDAGLSESPLGTATIAAGVSGWLGPLMVFTIANDGGPWRATAARALAFAALAMVMAAAGRRLRPRHVRHLLRATLDTSGQLAVRSAVLVLLTLMLAALALHVSVLLGAFAAGLVLRHVDPLDEARVMGRKLDAVGFGLLVPVFFVVTGMRLDIGVFSTGAGLGLVAVFLVAFLVVRGTPALLSLNRLRARDAAALGLFSSTKLPLLVVITATAVEGGQMTARTASTLVGAGMVSVCLFPLMALRLRRTGLRHGIEAHALVDDARAS